MRACDEKRYAAITQVSLVPPPCDELTTREPSRSATRVSPPGTRLIVRPDSTYGLRSICRGASPDSVNVGQVYMLFGNDLIFEDGFDGN